MLYQLSYTPRPVAELRRAGALRKAEIDAGR